MVILVYLLPWQARLIFRPGFLAGVPSEPQTVSLYAVEVLLAVLLLVRVIRWSSSGDAAKMFFGYGRRGDILVAFGSLVLLAIFSVIVSFDQTATVLLAWRLAEGFAILFMFATAPSEREARLAFAVSAVIQALIAIMQACFGRVYPDTWLGVAAHFPEVPGTSVVETAGGRFLRAYGFLPHPNILGGMLVVAIFSIRPLSRRFSGYAIAAYSVLSIGLFLTFSRLAWIALAIGIVSQWLYARRDRLFIKYMGVVLAAFAVCILIFAPLVFTRVSVSGRLEAKSISERVSSYTDALTLIKNHPLAGIGAGAFTSAVLGEVDANRNGYALIPAHSAPLVVLTELGVFGLLLYLWLLFVSSRSAWKCGKVGLGAALLALTVFDHWSWTTYAGILIFWAGWGLTMRSRNDGEVKQKAGALILSKDDPNKILLLYRVGPNYNDWTFPKGHMEDGESREDTAHREVKEETGLDIEIIKSLPDRDYVTGHGHPAVNHFFLARSLDDSRTRLEPGYPDNRLEWVPSDKVEDLLTWDNLKEYFQEVRKDLEAYWAKHK